MTLNPKRKRETPSPTRDEALNLIAETLLNRTAYEPLSEKNASEVAGAVLDVLERAGYVVGDELKANLWWSLTEQERIGFAKRLSQEMGDFPLGALHLALDRVHEHSFGPSTPLTRKESTDA